jgi:hypothetical protein
MKTNYLLISLTLMSISVFSCKTETQAPPVQKVEISEFIGQWTIDIEGGAVGWIEVRQEEDYIDADILWSGGSVLPVSNIFLAADRMLVIQRSNDVVRKRGENNSPVRTAIVTDWLEIVKAGEDNIEGIMLHPRRNCKGVDTTTFSGIKLPPVPPAPDMNNLKFGTPVTLFNGKDLTGWRLKEPDRTNGWKVVDGTLTNDPVQTEGAPHISYGNLRTDKEFEDFNLKLEVNVPEGSNSGVYLRGMYEISIMDTYKRELDPHHMGAVYSRIKPTTAAEKPAGEWQSMDITLCNRHITVILNGPKIIDNQPVYGPTGGAMLSDVFSPGPIYLQGDHGKIAYRNIVLTPIVK